MAHAAHRFYKGVSTAQIKDGPAHAVLLDGRRLKTPGKLDFYARSQRHADLVAAEWEAQSGDIKPDTMPLTRLYNVAIERTPQQRPAMIAEFRKYGSTDLLCYRADEPQSLRDRQERVWGPWIDWAKGMGAALNTTNSVIAVDQPDAALGALSGHAQPLGDLELTLLLHFTAVFGSAVLALAVMTSALEPGAAYDISRLDALYQAERWGEDEEAQDIAAQTKAEIIILGQLI